jgi:hypothetical protein
MITRGVSQEQKTPVLFSFNTDGVTLDSGGGAEVLLFKRKLDFSKIEYILVMTRMKMSSGLATGHLISYIDTTSKTDHTSGSDSFSSDMALIDCTSITGVHDLSMVYTNVDGNVVLGTVYIGVVDI